MMRTTLKAVASARQQSLGDMLRRSRRRHGARTAIICGARRLTYDELDDRVDWLASGLSEFGIRKGDRIALLARNSDAFVEVRFATARIGAILVPINFMLDEVAIRYVLDHCGARILFVDATTAGAAAGAVRGGIEAIFAIPGETELAPSGAGIAPAEQLYRMTPPPETDVLPDDPLQIVYTSGTESRPKGAVLSHAAVLWQYQSCIGDCEWSRETVALHALPLFHCAQLDAMLGPGLSVGATNVIMSVPSPGNILPAITQHQVTSFFAPPTVWISLLRSPLFAENDLSSLRRAYYGASIMPLEVVRELIVRLPGLRLWNLYGQTEIAPLATMLFPDEQLAHPGSVGRAVLHVTTRVVDDEMQDIPVGRIGEVVHRSPQLMTEYWQDPEKTLEAFAGGWFHSGDLATIDAEGYITIVDRKKDMIKTGGENVSSREVEEVLYAHPAVSEAAVVGLPHPTWIEAITAVIVLRDDVECHASDIIDHCARSLAGFKVPKGVVFRSEIPKNASGKIMKRDLRALIIPDDQGSSIEGQD
jgi:fatty-acyl-CoA synthase